MKRRFTPRLDSLEARTLLAIDGHEVVAILGTGTNPVGPLEGRVLAGVDVVHAGQRGDSDGFGHDTGTASAALSWNPDILIFPVVIVDDSGTASDASMTLGIRAAVAARVDVISISFSSPPRPGLPPVDIGPIARAIRNANRHGIPVIVAAGNASNDNDINPVFPAVDALEIPGVASVAATDDLGTLATFSNWGRRSVTLAAPGVDVPITTRAGTPDLWSGTSISTPEIAAAAAWYRSLHPHQSAARVIAGLGHLATQTPGTAGKTRYGAILASPVPHATPAPDPIPDPAPGTATRVVAALNAERSAAGEPPLTVARPLDASAQSWASSMADAGRLDHGDFYARISLVMPGRSAGEIIASGQATVEDVVADWMSSPGHRAHILDATYTLVGAGYATAADGTPYWCVDFTS